MDEIEFNELNDFHKVDGDEPDEEETSFIERTENEVNNDASEMGQIDFDQRTQLKRQAVDDYYNKVEKETGLSSSTGRDPNLFDLGQDGRLRLKSNPNMELTDKEGKIRKFPTIYRKRGGANAIRELGFFDWQPKKTLPSKAIAAVEQKRDNLSQEESQLSQQTLEEVGSKVKYTDEVSGIIQTKSKLSNAEIDEILGSMSDPPLNIRELRGLDKVMQSIRGELVNNLAKLSNIDERILRETQKLKSTNDDEEKQTISKRLQDLQDERKSRLEAASSTREKLRTQINRMKETINRILHEDTTLADRLRTLFKEQGITIFSLLTAVGMLVSTLVFALGGGGSGSGSPAADPKPESIVKSALKKIAKMLSYLASKIGMAIPSILGSLLSWLINFLSKTASWLASNTWVLMVSLISLILVAVKNYL